jgi:hypothetical protein
VSNKLNLSCGCKVYFFKDSDQISGADFCNIHIKLYDRLKQLERGELNVPPPDLGVSVSDGLGIKGEMK